MDQVYLGNNMQMGTKRTGFPLRNNMQMGTNRTGFPVRNNMQMGTNRTGSPLGNTKKQLPNIGNVFPMENNMGPLI